MISYLVQPSIIRYKNQYVQINFINNLSKEAITIHWHGQHVNGIGMSQNQYSDGIPHSALPSEFCVWFSALSHWSILVPLSSVRWEEQRDVWRTHGSQSIWKAHGSQSWWTWIVQTNKHTVTFFERLVSCKFWQLHWSTFPLTWSIHQYSMNLYKHDGTGAHFCWPHEFWRLMLQSMCFKLYKSR